MDGAFFPQSDIQVPEEEVSQHAGQHVVVPSRKLPHLIMIHTELGFSFFKTLLDGPTNTAEPHEEFESLTDWGVTDVVCVIVTGNLKM
jgi:hypothetical protein